MDMEKHFIAAAQKEIQMQVRRILMSAEAYEPLHWWLANHGVAIVPDDRCVVVWDDGAQKRTDYATMAEAVTAALALVDAAIAAQRGKLDETTQLLRWMCACSEEGHSWSEDDVFEERCLTCGITRAKWKEDCAEVADETKLKDGDHE